MKKIIKYVVPVFVIIAVASTVIYIKGRSLKQSENKSIPPAAMQDEIKARGEALYRQKSYAPVIALYQKLLEKNPDSLELKEKLGIAYFGAGDLSKAKPLLEEVDRAGKASPEAEKILRQMEK